MTRPQTAPRTAAKAGHPGPGPQPLFPASARRPAAIVAGCGAAVTTALAVLVAHTSRPSLLDRSADPWLIAHLGPHRRALTLIKDLGAPVDITIAAAVLVVVFLALRRTGLALLVVISVSVTALLTEVVLKPVIHRTLGSFLVYPSGHTGAAFAVATVIVVALLGTGQGAIWPRRAIRLVAMVACLGLAAVVGIAMVSRGDHYLTDVVGGAAFAVTVAVSATFLLDRPAIAQWLARADGRLAWRSRHGG
jgi:membrane-associated phospholipid phosphatase